MERSSCSTSFRLILKQPHSGCMTFEFASDGFDQFLVRVTIYVSVYFDQSIWSQLRVNNFRIGIYCMSLSGPVLATYSKYDKCALNEIVSGYFPVLSSHVPFNLSCTISGIGMLLISLTCSLIYAVLLLLFFVSLVWQCYTINLKMIWRF